MIDPSPRPWTAHDGEIRDARGEPVATVYRTEAWSSGDKIEHEDQANIAAMTAAPEMLALLQWLRTLHKFRSVHHILDDYIAKAEGHQHA